MKLLCCKVRIRRLKPLQQKHKVGLRRLQEPAEAGFVIMQPRIHSPGESSSQESN